MKVVLIQFLTAFISSLGFAMLFGLRRRFLPYAALGGPLCWGVYLVMDAWLHMEFLSCLLAAACSVVYAELLARRLKTPATLFVVPAILPLVPGGTLYYTMENVVHGRMEAARSYGQQTLIAAMALAAGISFVVALRELRARK